MHIRRLVLPLTFFLCTSLSACKEDGMPDDKVYTLYQNAPSEPSARVGIATFDMKWGEQWNYYYCQKFASFLPSLSNEGAKHRHGSSTSTRWRFLGEHPVPDDREKVKPAADYRMR